MKTDQTTFRKWVKDLWYENCAEYEAYNQKPMQIEVYWQKYKWWLKREYRHNQRRSSHVATGN